VKSDITRILLVNGHTSPRPDIRQLLTKRYPFRECALDDLASFAWQEPLEVLVDAPLVDEADVERVRLALRHLPKEGPGVAFIIEELSRPLVVRAHALGGEGVIARPISASALYTTIDSLLSRSRIKSWSSQMGAAGVGLAAGTEALEKLFRFAAKGTTLTQRELYDHGDSVIDTLAETGLGRWVEAVKEHHSQTFRHSLLVTGVAVGFGQHLSMRQDDLRRLAIGGLVHDIGKAAIPVDLLEKPSALSREEELIMREHTTLGRGILARQGGFAPELIDVVAHHHEMLDGSGYPDGLSGSGIKDLVRIVTISDIFAALIERRAYKLPLPNEEAFAYLMAQEGKLDMQLVRAFEPIAIETRLAA
jgi:putative nucleotidyltransferase with HDIG domain